MKLWVIIAGGCIFWGAGVLGAPVTQAEALVAARGWLRTSPEPLGVRVSATTSFVDTAQDEHGTALYYVVALVPEGYVICSADTLIEPILGFSATGHYEADLGNPFYALLEKDARGRVERVQQASAPKNRREISSPAIAKWKALRISAAGGVVQKGSGLASVNDPRVDPFILSTWSQGAVSGGACYNYYTPPYAAGSASNYVCGCNNTAWGQLMRYFQYPTRPVGTQAFTISVEGVATLRNLRGGNGAGGAYSWNLMPLNPVDPTTAERQAIGALCADIGVASGTSYAADGSSAGTSEQDLKDVFFYGNARYVSGQTCLAEAVRPNLDARLPVVLSIWGEAGGHAVLCDGYGFNLSTAYYHLNLGWGGQKDAWYNLPDVDTDWYLFDTLRGFQCNIYTNGTGEIISGRVLDDGLPVAGAVVSAVGAGQTNSTVTDARGIYALTRLPASQGYVLTAQKSGLQFMPIAGATGFSPSWSRETGNTWSNDFRSSPFEENSGFTLTPSNLFIHCVAGTTTVGVTNMGGGVVVYVARASESWLAISGGGSGTNGGTITVSYEANPYATARTGMVTVAQTLGSSASVTVVQAGNSWDAGYVDLGGGWRRLTWFGDYIAMGTAGWFWHSQHGFIFVGAEAEPDDIWLYTSDQGWLWTSCPVYPFLWRGSDGAWLWYNGSSQPRWFMNMTTHQWESWL